MSEELRIAKAFTGRYIAALALIAILSTGAYISLYLVISTQENTAAIVNVSGRQRMLSQRTALFAEQLADASPAERPAMRRQLRTAIDLMQRQHYGLIHGDPSLHLPDTMSPAVRALYFDGPDAVNTLVIHYIGWVDEVLALPDRELKPGLPIVHRILTVSRGRLLTVLDRVVGQYQREGEASVRKLHLAERGVWLTTLLLLAIEGLFIFRPFAGHMRRVIGALHRTQDELRTHQEALQRENEGLFRALVEQSIVGIYILQDGLFRYVNPVFATLFGYDSPDALIDRVGLADLAGEGSRTTVDEYLRRKLEDENDVDQLVFTGLRQDGGRIEVEAHGRLFEFRGRPAVLGLVLDITQRMHALEEIRRLNEQLERRVEERTAELIEANHELERSNRELDEFAYIASHDLKEPLRGIHNYASFLQEDYADRLDDEGRSFLERMQRLAERQTELLDRLLNYSRIGHAELAVEEVDLEQLLDHVAEDLKTFLANNQVELRRPAPLPKMSCNAIRAGEIFQNLIVNGAKYNDKPDKWVEVGCDPSGAVPVFSVRDNGIGIPPQHRDSVFRIFKRLHEQNKYGGGTGAGLTIVRKIIERHGGRIWLESVPGEGTTFYFTLSGTPT